MNLRNVLLIFLIVILGRMLPHPENITPIHALCILTGIYLPTRGVISALLLGYCCTDLLIAFSGGFSMFGSWSFYTYTGILGLFYLGTKIRKKNRQVLFALFGTLGFWLWTNLGVWLHSDMYLKTMVGFISCYVAAVPFLQKALLGDLIWFVTLSLFFPLTISKITRNNVISKTCKMADFRSLTWLNKRDN